MTRGVQLTRRAFLKGRRLSRSRDRADKGTPHRRTRFCSAPLAGSRKGSTLVALRRRRRRRTGERWWWSGRLSTARSRGAAGRKSSCYRAAVARSTRDGGSHAANQVDPGNPRLRRTSPGLGLARPRRGCMSDRRRWPGKRCATRGAPSELRCQTSRYCGKPMRVLPAARGWPHRPCPGLQGPSRAICVEPLPAGEPTSGTRRRLHPAA